MFCDVVDTSETYLIQQDLRRGFHVLLVRKDMLGTGKPFVPLWVEECEDAPTHAALIRWLLARKNEWQKWGRLAETLGHIDFLNFMRDRVRQYPLTHLIGSVVEFGDDPSEIVFSEQREGSAGVSTELLYTHRFSSAAARTAFDGWLTDYGYSQAVEALIHHGYVKGAISLGKMLNEIADDYLLAEADPAGLK